MIRCRVVSLDLDETLCDHRAAVQAGLDAALAAMGMSRHSPTAITAQQRFQTAATILKRRADRLGEPWWSVAEQLSMAFRIDREGADLRRAAAAFDAALAATLLVFPDVPAAIDGLRRAGFRVAVLSNGDGTTQRTKLARAGLLDRLDHVVVSGEVGAHKPDRRIFQALCGVTGVAPEDIVHVGDDPAHDVEGALAAGLHAVWVRRGPGTPDATVPPSVPTISSLAGLGRLLAPAVEGRPRGRG